MPFHPGWGEATAVPGEPPIVGGIKVVGNSPKTALRGTLVMLAREMAAEAGIEPEVVPPMDLVEYSEEEAAADRRRAEEADRKRHKEETGPRPARDRPGPLGAAPASTHPTGGSAHGSLGQGAEGRQASWHGSRSRVKV